MARLSLSLLGPFRATLDEELLTGFKSNKVRALLAYLAVRAGRLHRREVLAGLLWPDWPNGEALSNLRYALSNLRQVVGDRSASGGDPSFAPFLLTTRTTMQFNGASDYWLDVEAFGELVEAGHDSDWTDIETLDEAVGLYRGSFLEGFSLGDSPGFEEWLLLTREQLARQMSSTLHKLAADCLEQGDYERAQSYAWRQLALEPWDELAHRQVMRSLALSGQRSAALAQYETCRRLLGEELGVEPGKDTSMLYEGIRDGTVRSGVKVRGAGEATVVPLASPPAAAAIERPAFLDEDEAVEVEQPVFVAREPELLQLDGFLDMALGGRGRVVFVTGDAGSGKTALLRAFSRRAEVCHAGLVFATGNCNAYTGSGDPYSPFRQILNLLTGDVEAGWAAGVINGERARRLWRMLPVTTRAIVEHGPDLIDRFIPRGALLDRATTFRGTGLAGETGSGSSGADWLTRLNQLLEQNPGSLRTTVLQQPAIFGQFARVVQAVAREAPLVLLIDDLQWADAGSINLLFHLGRELTGSGILIVGAYRPEEVALGRRGERHPLDAVLNEFRRAFGDTTVDLDQTERWHFLEALLDSERNRLGPEFRSMLYRQTRGHPLFTIELLRGLQDRGDLVQDGEGRWVQGVTLDWERLPARVEAVVEERVSRLDQPLRTALRVASVEGEVFTAEVVARVLGVDDREILRSMSVELDRGHRLIRADSVQRTDGQLLSCYRFRHILFQKYLYGKLDEVERVHWHEQVGVALERLHGGTGRSTPIAVQLALHFERAGNTEKAIHYLQQAGEQAVQMSAYPEGIAHLTRALKLLETLPGSHDRAESELALQVPLVMARMDGIPGSEWLRAVTRARELCRQIGKTRELSLVLGHLSTHHYVRAEYQRARQLAEEALSLAHKAGDPALVALGHWHLGFICFGLGEPTTARVHLERVISFYDAEEHHHLFVQLRGTDAGLSALAYHACCLWCLGYFDQAAKRSRETLTLARRLDHPFSLADVVCFGGCVFNQMRRHAAGLKENAEELTRLSKGLGLTSFWGTGTGYLGEALAQLGQIEEGITLMRRSMSTGESTGTRCFLSGRLGAVAWAQAETGSQEEALVTLGEALAMVEETGERYFEAELLRLKGTLLSAQGREAEGETSLLDAVAVARRQRARAWELRATVSLCRLWQRQGKGQEAREALEEVYGWFAEGFDTRDLVEARGLLDELG